MTATLPDRPVTGLEYKDALLAIPGAGVLAVIVVDSWEFKANPAFDLTTDPEGTVWAVVAVTGIVDDVNDVIVPGAFRRSLSERKMRGVKGHNWERPVAVQRDAVELMPGDPRLPTTLSDGKTAWPKEAGALLVKAAYILTTSDGHDAWEEAKAYGLDQAYSIGYKVAKAREKAGVRYIYDLDVYEFSPVLHGANRLATLQAVKSGAPAGLEFADVLAVLDADTFDPISDDAEGKSLGVLDPFDIADTTYLDDDPADLDTGDEWFEGKGLRRVLNSAFWGLPLGTPITRHTRARGEGSGRHRAGRVTGSHTVVSHAAIHGEHDRALTAARDGRRDAVRDHLTNMGVGNAGRVADDLSRSGISDADRRQQLAMHRDDALRRRDQIHHDERGKEVASQLSGRRVRIAQAFTFSPDDIDAAAAHLSRSDSGRDRDRGAALARHAGIRRAAEHDPAVGQNSRGELTRNGMTVAQREKAYRDEQRRRAKATAREVRKRGKAGAGAGQGKSGEPDDVEATGWAALPVEVKARGPRKVVDAAYWGRPVGTLITPGMKPVGPRARAGAVDRGLSGQRGVGGGMGRAGIGGLRRDTDAALRARAANPDTRDMGVVNHIMGEARRQQPADLHDRVARTSDAEVETARDYLRNSYRTEDNGVADDLDGVLTQRMADRGVELQPGETPREARARVASTGNVDAARNNMIEAVAVETAKRYEGDWRKKNNLETFASPSRPLIASDDGTVAAMDRGRDDKGNERGFAVIDTRTGDILANAESAENVHDFVDGAADRIAEQERRDGSLGADGDGSLAARDAAGAGGDPGRTADGILRDAGDGGAGTDRGTGGQLRGDGTAGGDISGRDGSTSGGAQQRRVGSDQGDGSARSGAVGDDGERTGSQPGRGGSEPRSGAGGSGGDRASAGSDGVLRREGGDGTGGDGGDAVTDPDSDPGLAADGVTENDLPVPDFGAAQNLDTIPDGDNFRPVGVDDLAPAGVRAKLDANMAAVRLLRELQRSAPPRGATPDEQAVLARWAGWGGLPRVFDDAIPDYAAERTELRGLMSDSEWNEARRNTLNAHYTDARVTEALWTAVADLGFDGGRVLEPGSGSGNFIGFAPPDADMVGVELDSTTAGISKYLYPNATIRNESFAKTRVPDGAFDATVGNVPFGKFALEDRQHNPDGESIHNHFINKSLALTRPGGIVAVLTSRYTLDAQDSSARQRMADQGDLLGAVRLPTGSHQRASGTDVIEDILIFRKREPGAEPGDQSWVKASKRDVNGFNLPVSDYFTDHPENVLGALTAEKGQYGTGSILVRGDRDMGGLSAALAGIVADARADGRTATPRDGGDPLPELIEPDSSRHEGHIQREADGSFSQARNGSSQPVDVPKSQAAELGGLLDIRDSLRALLHEEASTSADTPRIDELRADLNARYDAYVAKFGPVNRFGYAKNGNRQTPPQGGFRRDPMSAIVRALESFDPTANDGKGEASKAAIFTKRASAPRELATTADNPADALSLSMDTYGEINLPEIARMLGTDENGARRQLGTMVHEVPPLSFDEEEAAVRIDRALRAGADPDPADETIVDGINASVSGARGELEPAAGYLSGNVRRKLSIARAAARHDDRFADSVAELERVQPRDLGPDEIDARLGAAWIGADVVQAFANDLMLAEDGYRNSSRVERIGSVWTVEGPTKGNLATDVWGTPSRPFAKLLQGMLEQRPIKITMKDGEKTVQDVDATLAAQAKAEEIHERFAEWVWEDPARARRLAAAYNDSFNSIALRNYDGAKRTFPGMAAGFKPRPHQVAAVERIVNEPTALLGHVVGAGKTAEMVMGTAELKRLGMARKPAIVVPNHMLDQFTKEYLEVYPQAKILAAGTNDLVGDKRREFVGRAAVGDWDVVILTQNAFESIPMSADKQKDYVDGQLAEMRAALEQAKAADTDGKSKSVKEMEKQVQSAESALDKLLAKSADKKDATVSFEETGIDYLMIDEAHHYSNLRTISRIANAGATGSGKATDLHMKMEYLRTRNESGRVATFATGTPIRNTVTQSYIMMKFLRPDLLQEAGIDSFDTWAATFGQVVEEMELKPEGKGFRSNSRFAKFRNVPELLRIFHTFADIKLAEDLKLPTPNLVGGRTETVTVGSSDSLRAYIADLGERAEMVRSGGVEPEDDNMLKISMDGRKAALSMALVNDPETGRPAEHEPGKIEAAADRIAGIWTDNKDRIYPVNPKEPQLGDDPKPGALQLVFLDLGTPNSDGRFDGYDKLRAELIARGLDGSKIRFMHEAANDAQKAELFAAAKNGTIDVLIGSTEKMGTGTNVQKRAVALHHLDAPWRPSDVEQRDGRIVRQGNANPDVQVIRYVTEGSFDAYMWQTLERKAKFINQIMKGSLDVREIEDVGDSAMSYAEVKALATGNPDLLTKSKVDALRNKLERLNRTHGRTQTNLRNDVGLFTIDADKAESDAEKIGEAIARRTDTRGDAFSMTIDGVAHTKRSDAAEVTRVKLAAVMDELVRAWGRDRTRPIGSIGGQDITATYVDDRKRGPGLVLRIDGVPGDIATIGQGDLDNKAIGAGAVARIESSIGKLDQRQADLLDRAEQRRVEVARMSARVGQEFPRLRELEASRAKSARLQKKMELDAAREEALGAGWRDRLDNPDDEGTARLSEETRARLAFDPAIDTDRDDDPILGSDSADVPLDDGPVVVVPATAERAPAAGEPAAATVEPPSLDLSADELATGGDAPAGLDARSLDVARGDADAALLDGDHGILTSALTRMGVPSGDNPGELADMLLNLPEGQQRTQLDQIELVNARDDEQAGVLGNQRARIIDASTTPQGLGDPAAPDGAASVPPFASRADVITHITAAGTGDRAAVSDFLRLNRGPDGYAKLDPAQQRMALAAVAGRGVNSREFHADEARNALVRLAENDPTLPAASLGQQVTLTESDDSDPARPLATRQVTGRVIDVKPTPGRMVTVVIERDGGPRDGVPNASQTVRADAVLHLDDVAPPAATISPDDVNAADALPGAQPDVVQGDAPDVGATAGTTASAPPAPRFDELGRGTFRSLGIRPGDRIAVSTDQRNRTTVLTGVYGTSNTYPEVTTDDGRTISFGGAATVVYAAKLDDQGRVVALPTAEGAANARGANPTPESSRARTNRVNAATELAGGHGGGGSRRVKNGSVHTVSVPDDPTAIEQVTAALNGLGWAGMYVSDPGPAFPYPYGSDRRDRRSIEIRVPDTAPDGTPLRTFGDDGPAVAPTLPQQDLPEAAPVLVGVPPGGDPTMASTGTPVLRELLADAEKRSANMGRIGADTSSLDEMAGKYRAELAHRDAANAPVPQAVAPPAGVDPTRLVDARAQLVSPRTGGLRGTVQDAQAYTDDELEGLARQLDDGSPTSQRAATSLRNLVGARSPQTGQADDAPTAAPRDVTTMSADELDAERGGLRERIANAAPADQDALRARRLEIDSQRRALAQPPTGGDAPEADAPAAGGEPDPSVPDAPTPDEPAPAESDALTETGPGRWVTADGRFTLTDDPRFGGMLLNDSQYPTPNGYTTNGGSRVHSQAEAEAAIAARREGTDLESMAARQGPGTDISHSPAIPNVDLVTYRPAPVNGGRRAALDADVAKRLLVARHYDPATGEYSYHTTALPGSDVVDPAEVEDYMTAVHNSPVAGRRLDAAERARLLGEVRAARSADAPDAAPDDAPDAPSDGGDDSTVISPAEMDAAAALDAQDDDAPTLSGVAAGTDPVTANNAAYEADRARRDGNTTEALVQIGRAEAADPSQADRWARLRSDITGTPEGGDEFAGRSTDDLMVERHRLRNGGSGNLERRGKLTNEILRRQSTEGRDVPAAPATADAPPPVDVTPPTPDVPDVPDAVDTPDVPSTEPAPAELPRGVTGVEHEPYMDKPDAQRIKLSDAQRNEVTYAFEDTLTGDQDQDDALGAYLSLDGNTLDVHDRAATLTEIDHQLEVLDDNLRGTGSSGTSSDKAMWRKRETAWRQLRDKVAKVADPAGDSGDDQPADAPSVDAPNAPDEQAVADTVAEMARRDAAALAATNANRPGAPIVDEPAGSPLSNVRDAARQDAARNIVGESGRSDDELLATAQDATANGDTAEARRLRSVVAFRAGQRPAADTAPAAEPDAPTGDAPEPGTPLPQEDLFGGGAATGSRSDAPAPDDAADTAPDASPNATDAPATGGSEPSSTDAPAADDTAPDTSGDSGADTTAPADDSAPDAEPQPRTVEPHMAAVSDLTPGDQIDIGDPEPATVASLDTDDASGNHYVETVEGDRVEFRPDDKVYVTGHDDSGATADGPTDTTAPDTTAPDDAAPDAPADGAPLDDAAPAGPDAATASAAAAEQASIGADQVAEAQQLESDALGLVVADDGELEVTPDVAERQTRIEGLLAAAQSGELDVTAQSDSELTGGRRDLVDELRLQEAVRRRDLAARQQRKADAPARAAQPAVPDVNAPDGGDGEQATTNTVDPTDTPAAPAPPKRRPGLAGSAEDLADAIEGGDNGEILRAAVRARLSLTRSANDTGAHDDLRVALDDLAAGKTVDAAHLRTIAAALRETARTKRNDQARNRRTVKRLERERLRSLIGTYDAELRNRGQNPDDHGGPLPAAGPSDADIAAAGPDDPAAPDGLGDAPDPGAGQGDTPADGAVVDGPAAPAGPAGQGVGDRPDQPVPLPTATFDRSDPDGPSGQARTTELVDGLAVQPWRMLGRPEVVLGSDPEQATKRRAAARSAFGPVLDQFGPMVRRRDNETLEAAARSARARVRRMQHGAQADLAVVTFAELLPASQRGAFMEAMRAAVPLYKSAIR